MDPVLVRFLEKFPNAAAAASASLADVTQLAGPLGLQERRPSAIIRFSRETKNKNRCFEYMLSNRAIPVASLEMCCDAWLRSLTLTADIAECLLC